MQNSFSGLVAMDIAIEYHFCFEFACVVSTRTVRKMGVALIINIALAHRRDLAKIIVKSSTVLVDYSDMRRYNRKKYILIGCLIILILAVMYLFQSQAPEKLKSIRTSPRGLTNLGTYNIINYIYISRYMCNTSTPRC